MVYIYTFIINFYLILSSLIQFGQQLPWCRLVYHPHKTNCWLERFQQMVTYIFANMSVFPLLLIWSQQSFQLHLLLIIDFWQKVSRDRLFWRDVNCPRDRLFQELLYLHFWYYEHFLQPSLGHRHLYPPSMENWIDAIVLSIHRRCWALHEMN